MLECVTAPVAVTVPVTATAFENVAVSFDPLSSSILVLTPPLLTKNCISLLAVALVIVISLDDDAIVKSDPTSKLPTVSAYDVLAAWSLRKNCPDVMPDSDDALVTVPVTTAPVIAVDNWNPGTIVVNPLMPVPGVYVVSLLKVATTVLLI